MGLIASFHVINVIAKVSSPTLSSVSTEKNNKMSGTTH